jgi:hypothetical protein
MFVVVVQTHFAHSFYLHTFMIGSSSSNSFIIGIKRDINCLFGAKTAVLFCFIIIFNLRTAAFKAYCAIWVRRSNFRHQAFPRVSPCESTQRRKVELWARNVREFCLIFRIPRYIYGSVVLCYINYRILIRTPSETWVKSQASPYGIFWWTKWCWDKFFFFFF